MFKKRIYLDYASLTPVDPRVVREMKKYSSREYANPSSLYKEGVLAKKAVEEGRKQVASFINVHSDEIIFTSGGTEANGLALEGAGRTAHRNGIAKPHLIISAIEHSSIIETANMMEKHGVRVTRLPVNSAGIISVDELAAAITSETFMISIMSVNNEIGSIQPIREIAKVIRRSRDRVSGNVYPLFHTDAAQAYLLDDFSVEKLGIDLMTLDGAKTYGPRGIGALYVKRGTPIEQIIYGGGQEKGMRSGTENVPAIKGFAKSLEIAAEERSKENGEKLVSLKKQMIEGLKKIRSDISVNGDLAHSSPHILNITIPGVDSEFLVLQLDAKGIACSTKSSCLRDEDESYVLKAIGAVSASSIRFSFGRWTKQADIRQTLAILGKILHSR